MACELRRVNVLCEKVMKSLQARHKIRSAATTAQSARKWKRAARHPHVVIA
jgi:hypothetical protein